MNEYMPLKVIESNGGPFNDDAFIAGFELGVLHVYLRFAGSPFSFTIHRDCAEQADLLAMSMRYSTYVICDDPEMPDHVHIAFSPEAGL